MLGHWWSRGSALLVLVLVHPGLAQDLIGGAAANEEEAEDARAEEFDSFSILGEPAGPTADEQAEVERLNAAGLAKAQQGDIEGALTDFENASQIAPNFPSYYHYGRLLREQGAAARAIQMLGSAIQQLRNVPEEEFPAAATATYLELGLAYLDPQEFNNAIQTFQQAQLIRGQRNNVELIYNQGRAQAEFALNQQFATAQSRSEDLLQAVGLFDRALELNPNHVDSLYERGNANFMLGNLDEAVEDLAKSVELDPTKAEAVAQYGFVSLRRGLIEAQRRNGDAEQIHSDLTMAIDQFGRFINLLPEDREAVQELELDVSRESALISRSAAYIALGDEQPAGSGTDFYRRAIADADAALEVEPVLADAHFQKGIAYRMMNQLDRSAEEYTEALEISPGNTEGLLRRGIVFFRQGDLELAQNDLTRAIRYSAEANTRAHFWLGLTYASRDNPVRAIHEFDLAIRYQPRFTLAYLNRGISHMRTGRFQRAVEDFTRVLSRNPNHEQARTLRAKATAALAARS